MKKKYFVDRMTYKLKDSPIDGKKEYWEDDIDPITMQTNDLKEAIKAYDKEIEHYKNNIVEVLLCMNYEGNIIPLETYSNLDENIMIRV